VTRAFRPVPILSVAGTVFAGVFVGVQVSSDPGPAAEVVAAIPKKPGAAIAPTLAIPVPRAPEPDLADRSRAIPQSEGELFAARNWQPSAPPLPPPAPPARPAPPPPTAPPLPFTFVGMVEKGIGKPQAFLAKGEALLIVGDGDVIDNDRYRVDSLSSSSIVLTYLPLKQRQTLMASGGQR
jgi:hypothetical protein